jgi:methylamine dehydrogenase light chain
MRKIDQLCERSTRAVAQRTSRRSLLASLGQLLTGAALVPLLPVVRAGRARADEAAPRADSPESCNYWKYCAIDGFLCSCCGGTAASCPPGTTPSPISWVGTCHNAADGRDYVVSYNDCCGKSTCGTCDCARNEGEKPIYRPSRNNDLNWCLANAEVNYHCTVSVILGVAEK